MSPLFFIVKYTENTPLFVLTFVVFKLEFFLTQTHLSFYRKLTCADLKEKELLISCKNQCPKEVSHVNKEILELMAMWNFVNTGQAN